MQQFIIKNNITHLLKPSELLKGKSLQDLYFYIIYTEYLGLVLFLTPLALNRCIMHFGKNKINTFLHNFALMAYVKHVTPLVGLLLILGL